VLVCTLYSITDAAAANIASAAQAGATVLVSYFSGIVDEHDHIRLGGYPGAFRELLGVRVEEFHPLLAGTTIKLSDGLSDGGVGSVWSEHVHVADVSGDSAGGEAEAAADVSAASADGPGPAEVLATFTEYPLAGVPALTRRAVGAGSAWYLATFPDRDGIEALVDRLLAAAGISAVAEADHGVELTRRRAEGRSFVFAINHSRADATVRVVGADLLTGERFTGTVPAGGVAVIAED
jgi:beta-galactosidase